jgi:rhodanese-related sulfurtransferase
MVPNPDFLSAVEAAYPKDTKIVVGCQAGGRSLRAAEMMTGAGYTQIIDQRAGFGGARDAFGQVVEPGWAAAGLPVETGAPAKR